MGSVLGGALVTVTGTGFAVDQLGDVSVDINGIPCQVKLKNNFPWTQIKQVNLLRFV